MRARRRKSGRRSLLWPLLALPGAVWLALLFVAPLYVVLSIVFGGVDPVFRTPLPVYNPLKWDSTQFTGSVSVIVRCGLCSIGK